jgi:signal transduction histidine kinase
VSRVAAGRITISPEPFDLADTVRTVVARFRDDAEAAHSRLTVKADAQVWGHWDRLRVEQITTNLLSNAIKYGAGGEIEVSIESTPDVARFTVRDHGIGIAAPDQRRIFGRFERAASVRHYGGFGLGLYLSRQIAEAHGGSIEVRSEQGKGATFTVVLPREPLSLPAVAQRRAGKEIQS